MEVLSTFNTKCSTVFRMIHLLSNINLTRSKAPYKKSTALLNHASLYLPQQELIIALLSNAVAQFKKYKCPRMKSHLSEYRRALLISTGPFMPPLWLQGFPKDATAKLEILV